MFGTIRKHQTWLWAVIITLTIISFVIFFSPYSKMNSDRRGPANYGSINGVKVTETQFYKAQREVLIHYFLMYGSWPEEDKKNNFDPLRETYQWMLLVQKQEQLGIHASTAQVAEVARERLRPFERMGITSPTIFVEKVLQARGLSVDDFEGFCRHFLGIQQLVTSVGTSGKLVTPQEVKALYEREHQELATDIVFFNGSNYLANVTVTPAALGQFFTNQMSRYRVPDRVQVGYVRYNVSNYFAQAETELQTNLNELVEMNFQKFGTNAFPTAKSPTEVKALIRERVIRTQAMSVARKQALAFANELQEMPTMVAANLDTLAKKKGLEMKVSAPFDREDGPRDMDVGPDFGKRAFALNADEPFVGPVHGLDGEYVVALLKKLPSEIPSLDSIREQVTADFKYSQAVNLARQAGMAFYPTLTNGLAQQKSFAALCTEANLKPVPLPAFSLSTRSLPEAEAHLTLNQLKQTAFAQAAGKSGGFQYTADGGFILHVKSKLPLDEAKMQADLPAFANYVRRSRQEEAFQQWFRREADRGLRDTPIAKPQPQSVPAMGSGPAKS